MAAEVGFAVVESEGDRGRIALCAFEPLAAGVWNQLIDHPHATPSLVTQCKSDSAAVLVGHPSEVGDVVATLA